MEVVDHVFDEDDTPVVTRYGIVTGQGTLQLARASFAGQLPDNEMPTEVVVSRIGGNTPAESTYAHESTYVPVIESLKTKLVIEQESNVRLSRQMQPLHDYICQLRHSNTMMRMQAANDLNEITMLRCQLTEINEKKSASLFNKIRRFFKLSK